MAACVTQVNMDLYDARERSVSYMVPKWITFWRSYPVLERTQPGAIFYNISLGNQPALKGLRHQIFTNYLTVQDVDCVFFV